MCGFQNGMSCLTRLIKYNVDISVSGQWFGMRSKVINIFKMFLARYINKVREYEAGNSCRLEGCMASGQVRVLTKYLFCHVPKLSQQIHSLPRNMEKLPKTRHQCHTNGPDSSNEIAPSPVL